MGIIRIFLILVIFCAAGFFVEGKLRPVKKCGLKGLFGGAPEGFSELEMRIVGGEPADFGDYPWMVTIQIKARGLHHLCGGTVIDKNWVVTAAHCFKYSNKTSDYAIYVGAHKLKSNFILNGEKYQVKEIILHENYNRRNYSNDIALIRTANPLRISRTLGLVNAICLPPKDENPTRTAIVTGWGHTRYKGTGTDVLHEVEVPLVSWGRCEEFYGRNRLSKSVICAGGISKDSCQSDSGGPLMQRNSKGRYTLIGIVSYGRGCGSRTPGVYTKVSAYIDWMNANMIGKFTKLIRDSKRNNKSVTAL